VVRLTSNEPNELGVKVSWQRRLPLAVVRWGDVRWSDVRRGSAGSAVSLVYLLITIISVGSSHPHLWGQQVTTQAPAQSFSSGGQEGGVSSSVDGMLPQAPGVDRYPMAEVVPDDRDMTTVTIESDGPQSKTGTVYTVDENVVITYGDRVVRADHVEFDTETGDLTATGHLRVTGGRNHEDIKASHGTMNMKDQTGRFYDVDGSVGLKNPASHAMVYANSNPFLFTGRIVVRTGPEEYEIYDGTLTSCQLPNPDWMLYAGKFTVDSVKAKAQKSVFRLMNIPVLFLPYVTHPVDAESRQSGVLIPELPITHSSTKGFVTGEQFYWAINRSADVTVGAQYYSLRGWEQSGMFRYRGLGNDFAKARYSGLLDRGITTNGVYLNQGGEDVTFSGRHDFSAQTRIVGDAEYLSSFAYREAFAEGFSLAVSSDIFSVFYGVHEADGFSESIRSDRYQGLKLSAVAATPTTPAIPEEQVRIFHAPSLDFSGTEHELGRSGLFWSFEASQAGLSRVQPSFATGGLTQRLDVHPEIAYPMSFGGWNIRASAGLRETVYNRSRHAPYGPNALPVELPSSLNRSDGEVEVEVRAPVVERTFDSKKVEKMFGHDLRHTIEPEFTYRYVGGVNNFLNVLRFDDVDIASDTNELEYGVTQRLFLRPVKEKPCKEAVKSKTNPNLDNEIDQVQRQEDSSNNGKDRKPTCGSRELISWKIAQKHFFNEDFGGAVVNGARNIFDTTLNFSGVAFLTEPRAISPLISRLRVRTSEHMDLEWDFDYDTGAKKFTSDNVFVDVHENNIFAGLSYARLNAPGRFYTEGVTSAVSDFDQLRVLLGYGSPTKPGLVVAGNIGMNLNTGSSALVQYEAVQASYNWNCCGFSVEVRKYELGVTPSDTAERFSFTLLNIGTAGNLRKTASLF
jgi:LPS-assembly protein